MSKKAFLLLTSSMFLVACASTPAPVSAPVQVEAPKSEKQVDQKPATPEVINDIKPEPQAQVVSAADKVTMRLIKMGQYALSERRLLTPEEDNANMYFQIALGRDPGNYEAILGISNIVDTYLDWAIVSAGRGDFNTAYTYLNNARFVNQNDPNISTAADRVARIEKRAQGTPKATAINQSMVPDASEDVFILPKDLFQLSEEEILAKMQPIIDRILALQKPIEINWPSDKEGRLIYQILNSRTPDFRVRAMIYHRARYTVEMNE